MPAHISIEAASQIPHHNPCTSWQTLPLSAPTTVVCSPTHTHAGPGRGQPMEGRGAGSRGLQSQLQPCTLGLGKHVESQDAKFTACETLSGSAVNGALCSLHNAWPRGFWHEKPQKPPCRGSSGQQLRPGSRAKSQTPLQGLPVHCGWQPGCLMVAAHAWESGRIRVPPRLTPNHRSRKILASKRL